MKNENSRFLIALTASSGRREAFAFRIDSGSWLEKHVFDGIRAVDVDCSSDMASRVFVLEATVNDVVSIHASIEVPVKKIAQLFRRSGKSDTIGRDNPTDLLFHE